MMQARLPRVIGLVLLLAFLIAATVLTNQALGTDGASGTPFLPAVSGGTATGLAGRSAPTSTTPRSAPAANRAADGLPAIAFARLPPEAQETIRLIERGGPFPYAKDGTIFRNREGLLPRQPEGYYREYTVVTPGARDRGARRIVAGEGDELYYTDDHYSSFKRVTE